MSNLSLAVFIPLVGAGLVLLAPQGERTSRPLGLLAAFLSLVHSVLVLLGFDKTLGTFQMQVDWPWVPALGIRFHLGVDGISLWLMLLASLMVFLTLLSPHAMGAQRARAREFVVAMLVLEAGMLGAFLAVDLFAFYVFWEVMLIPMYFIIGVWGGEQRVHAALKFVIFTMVGSLLMLAAILYVYVQVHRATGQWTFDYVTWSTVALPRTAELLCFLAFALAFLIKVPIFPLHTWQPDAYVEASTGGSMLLAAVLAKFGAYGLLRFALPLFPVAALQMAPVIAWLAVASIVFGALMAWVQHDLKRLVAYSSLSHMGFVVLGIITLTQTSVEGGLFQMLAHGIAAGGLFLAVGVLQDRRGTTLMADFGGLWKQTPLFAASFLVIVLTAVGLPGLCGFVGEFLVLMGTFTAGKDWQAAGLHVPLFGQPALLASVATGAGILAAVYLLTMFQRVMFGSLDKTASREPMRDLGWRERFVFGVLVVAALFMGLMPQPIIERTSATVKALTSGYASRLAEARNNPDGPAHRITSGVRDPRAEGVQRF